MGFLYVKNWLPLIIPLFTFLTGSFSLLGFIYIGQLIKENLKIDINNIWNNLISLILGIFSFSLIIQIVSFLGINNKLTLGILASVSILAGFGRIFFLKLSIPKIDKKTIIPSTILIAIFFIRILFAIIPTTKIDELHYHMLLPIRLTSENGLNFYSYPWEGAIWPHMHYQFIGAPFYSIGLPDSLNIISLGIFLIFLITLFFQINNEINNKELSIWCLLIFSSGLYSLIDLTTNSSNSLLLVSSCSSLLILCDPNKYLPTKDLRSFSMIFGLFSLGMIGSKISMMPILIIQAFIFLITIYKIWGIKSIYKSTLYFLLPFVVFYVPTVLYTWIKSGSPFGPLLSSFFEYKGDFDPLVSSANGEIGYRGNLKEFIFFCITKWSPLVWLSWIFFINKKISCSIKTIFLTFLIIQSLIIWLILPDVPRHFSGFQYVGILIIFVELIPKFFKKYKKLSRTVFLLFSFPWFLLDIYYSYPLISKAFFNPERFKKDYVAFYEDFILLNNLLEKDSEILFYGSRINSYHSPRKVLFESSEIKKNENEKYLFIIGSLKEKNLSQRKIIGEDFIKVFEEEGNGKLVYINEKAKIICYRKPNKKCKTNQVRVYKLN